MSNFTYTCAFNLSESLLTPPLVVRLPMITPTTLAASVSNLSLFRIQSLLLVANMNITFSASLNGLREAKSVLFAANCFQELLSAVEKERLLKNRNISSSSPISIHHSHEAFHSGEEESQFSSFDEQFFRHLTEAAHRRCLLRRRENQISSSLVPSHDSRTMANLDHISAHQYTNPCPSPGSMTPSPVSGHSSVPPGSNNASRISPGRSPSRSSQSQDTPEASSLPEAIKSKLAAASAKYKESISKSKQGLKEKLLARNNSVKELSKGVQREMNAGLAGVARMVERLELASKRFRGSAHVSTSTASASGFNFSFKGKRVEANSKSNNNGNKTVSH